MCWIRQNLNRTPGPRVTRIKWKITPTQCTYEHDWNSRKKLQQLNIHTHFRFNIWQSKWIIKLMHFQLIGWKKKIRQGILQVSKHFFSGLDFVLYGSWAHLAAVISSRDRCYGRIWLAYHWVALAYFFQQAHYYQLFVYFYLDAQLQLAFQLLLPSRKLKPMSQAESRYETLLDMHF